MACTDPSPVRSLSSAEDVRAPVTTWAPLAARPRTTARPIPLLPPVTTAIFPARPRSIGMPPPLATH